MIDEHCNHERTRYGEDAPRRWGSHRTRVCVDCGRFRLETHRGDIASDWLAADEYREAVVPQELD